MEEITEWLYGSASLQALFPGCNVAREGKGVRGRERKGGKGGGYVGAPLGCSWVLLFPGRVEGVLVECFFVLFPGCAAAKHKQHTR